MWKGFDSWLTLGYTHSLLVKTVWKSNQGFSGNWMWNRTMPPLSPVIRNAHTVCATQPTALIFHLPAFCLIHNFLYHRQVLFISYFVGSYNLSSTFGSSSAPCRISLKQWLIKYQHSCKGGSKTILHSSRLSLTISVWGTKNCISS